MTFFKNLMLMKVFVFVFQHTEGFSLIQWIHTDFMFVRFGGMRNAKTWSKSTSN